MLVLQYSSPPCTGLCNFARGGDEFGSEDRLRGMSLVARHWVWEAGRSDQHDACLATLCSGVYCFESRRVGSLD
ncbi:hypothetical protein E2C01_063801 [Portunus trituberculatus]|uniref:Uncharacterized protein n=1 Tax=Portunus trituberculatus TaxID=210409 RepID=A0A5B7HEN2_PORTR|nr:hypothetical protein [Portunus trituberculatus]